MNAEDMTRRANLLLGTLDTIGDGLTDAELLAILGRTTAHVAIEKGLTKAMFQSSMTTCFDLESKWMVEDNNKGRVQ